MWRKDGAVLPLANVPSCKLGTRVPGQVLICLVPLQLKAWYREDLQGPVTPAQGYSCRAGSKPAPCGPQVWSVFPWECLLP